MPRWNRMLLTARAKKLVTIWVDPLSVMVCLSPGCIAAGIGWAGRKQLSCGFGQKRLFGPGARLRPENRFRPGQAGIRLGLCGLCIAASSGQPAHCTWAVMAAGLDPRQRWLAAKVRLAVRSEGPGLQGARVCHP